MYVKSLLILIVILLLLVILYSYNLLPLSTRWSQSSVVTSNRSGQSYIEPDWGKQTKTSGCRIDGPLQDSECTPGAIFPQATAQEICTPGYAGSVRNVSQPLKRKVYASYGIKTRLPGQYEIDHLVSLQLGGSNDISNLWPEPEKPFPGYRQKNQVENYLHDQVCSGKISLREAQSEIATNWLQYYSQIPPDTNPNDASDES
ncbi:hypothetical protein KDA_73200 [Dictyobacter alpinus]|uniref:Uncharacterized protein n=1 Tax=Dictyobacter alpinus TaxID=2014873 RepID=A0A402BKI2_9CHLR|nr:HNH endonuclease signature motif containing protein [Dictyobacter alpinus]GCE31836.1 hypothetical protein KDA_73200 [Dictyobacter alpinus]